MENNENNIISNEVKKEKNNKGIIALLVIIIIAMAGYIVYDKVIKDNIKEDKNQEEVNDSEEVKETELGINSDLVSKLESYIPGDFIYPKEGVYSNKLIKVNDLSNQFILYQGFLHITKDDEFYTGVDINKTNNAKCDFTYHLLGVENCYIKNSDESEYCKAYDRDIIEKNIKSVFGNNVNYIDENFEGESYKYSDRYYINSCGSGVSYTVFQPRKSTKIYNAIQVNDEIHIYEKYVFAVPEFPNSEDKTVSISIYKDNNKLNKIDDMLINRDDDLNETMNTIIDKYEKDSVQYKHTFKKNNDGEYYWYSTEPVE